MSARPPTATCCNPVWQSNLPDPFVLKVHGRYYAYGTDQREHVPTGDRVFPVLASPDLAHWQQAGHALQALGAPYYRYWAPEVSVRNGIFLLYYAVHAAEFQAGIRVAESQSPEGPFVDSGLDLTGDRVPWAIDPHVFCDHDGRWYLFMTVELCGGPDHLFGVGNVVTQMRDPFTLQGQTAVVTWPRYDWQLFERQRAERGGVDWYCVEGPAVVRHRDRYYAMFSGGCYYGDNYAVSYAAAPAVHASRGVLGASWQEAMDQGEPTFLLRGRPGARSPGHNSVVVGPNNVDTYLAYHTLSSDLAMRRPCLDRLFWHGKRPWTAGPTTSPQESPALPRWSDLCAQTQTTLGAAWAVERGGWTMEAGAVTLDGRDRRAILPCRIPLGSAWLLETNLRLVAGDGRFGVELRGDEGTLADVTIEPRGTLAVWTGLSQRRQTLLAALPAEFAKEEWHQLLMAYAGSVLRLSLDGLPLAECVLGGLNGSMTLLAEGCLAAFTGLSLTDHFRDEFQGSSYSLAALGWTAVTLEDDDRVSRDDAGWRVHDGWMNRTAPAIGCSAMLKGPALETFECGATMQLREELDGGKHPAFGLTIWRDAAPALRLMVEKHAESWAVHAVSHGAVTPGTTPYVPVPFGALDCHTLRARQRRYVVDLFLDGEHVLQVPAHAQPARFGIVVQDAAAMFTSAWLTGNPEASGLGTQSSQIHP